MDDYDADRRSTGAAVAGGSERASLLTRVRSQATGRWQAAKERRSSVAGAYRPPAPAAHNHQPFTAPNSENRP